LGNEGLNDCKHVIIACLLQIIETTNSAIITQEFGDEGKEGGMIPILAMAFKKVLQVDKHLGEDTEIYDSITFVILLSGYSAHLTAKQMDSLLNIVFNSLEEHI
jgi:hypothetical protein